MNDKIPIPSITVSYTKDGVRVFVADHYGVPHETLFDNVNAALAALTNMPKDYPVYMRLEGERK